MIRQYEVSKKLNRDREYPCKKDEDIEDEIECTFQPQIYESQRAVQGYRASPIFAPTQTQEELREIEERRKEEEMLGCTFKPELNQNSLKMADYVSKRKKEAEERNAKKKDDIIPLMKIAERKVNNKASMFFDVHSYKAQEKLEKHKEDLISRNTTNSQNEDIYDNKIMQNMMTPQFEETKQTSEVEVKQLPVLPDRDSFGSEEEDEDIDRMIKQVIFDGDFLTSSKYSTLEPNKT